jgi:hypothetical protein
VNIALANFQAADLILNEIYTEGTWITAKKISRKLLINKPWIEEINLLTTYK